MKSKKLIFIVFALMAGWLLVWPNFSGPAMIDNLWQPPAAKNKIAESVPKDKRPITEEQSAATEIKAKEKLPEKMLLAVPFLSQAPFANWDALHEDACEEASLIMLKYFLAGETTIGKELGEKKIQALVKYERENGYGESITLAEVAEVAEEYYGVKNPRLEKKITAEKIKRELAGGRPVIIPAAGKLLANPNFKNGGPVYHMLIIKGYDEAGFVTNDPGTRKGEGFRYSFENILKANHNWNKKNILDGEAVYLVFD